MAALLCLAEPTVSVAQTEVSLGELPAGESVTIELVVVAGNPVPAGLDGFSTQGTVSGGNFPDVVTDDPDVGGATDPTVTLLDAVPELGIVKTYDGTQPFPGETIPFDLSFVNNGNQGATGIEISETVPDDTTFNAGASTLGWTCLDGSPAGTPCGLAVGGLNGGGAAGAAIFAVDLDDPLPPGTGEVVNTASIADDGANGVDPVPGNDSGTETVLLDIQSPTILAVDTLPATPDGELTECETVTGGVDRFLIGFSEAMRDPPGDVDPDDVTNPDNFLLVGAGPDLAYDTAACGDVMGDDVALPIADVTYDELTDVATLRPAARLPDGLHRLLACGSTTLRDATGNALDGDGDGTGGDDFAVSFRNDRRNLFANGHFDCGADAWVAESSGGAVQSFDPMTDGEGSPESGAAMASVSTPGPLALAALGQCVELGPGLVEIFGRARIGVAASQSLIAVRLGLGCDYHPVAACADAPVGVESHVESLGDSADAFVTVGAQLAVPPGTLSGLCSATWEVSPLAVVDLWLDGLTAHSIVFADGFESGDTSAWSVTVP